MTPEPECPSCRAAQDDPTTPLFHSGCLECQARMLANSPAFFQAKKAGYITSVYNAALVPVFGTEVIAGNKRVKDWARRIEQARQLKRGQG
ncbi:MAG: hypothetical protein LBH31_00595 [Burkholderiaceae bacterium]|jgi:hypothetical protein|nr:hypothetical protein [Burkholderiaceae bacterium]